MKELFGYRSSQKVSLVRSTHETKDSKVYIMINKQRFGQPSCALNARHIVGAFLQPGEQTKSATNCCLCHNVVAIQSPSSSSNGRVLKSFWFRQNLQEKSKTSMHYARVSEWVSQSIAFIIRIYGKVILEFSFAICSLLTLLAFLP